MAVTTTEVNAGAGLARDASELAAAMGARNWFEMVKPTFVAAGWSDGHAAVLSNSGGWQMVHHVNGQPVVKTFGSAAEAVAAADALADPLSGAS